MKIKEDLIVLSADDPKHQKSISWTIKETIGVGVFNSRGINYMMKETIDKLLLRKISIYEHCLKYDNFNVNYFNIIYITGSFYNLNKLDGEYIGDVRITCKNTNKNFSISFWDYKNSKELNFNPDEDDYNKVINYLFDFNQDFINMYNTRIL